MFSKTKRRPSIRERLVQFHPLVKLILFFPLLLAGLLSASLFLNVTAGALGIPPRNELVNELSLLTGIIISIGLSRLLLKTVSVAESGLKTDPFAFTDFLRGFGIAAALMGVFLLILFLFGWIRVLGFAWTVRSGRSILNDLTIAFIYMFAVGVAEELLFRGFLLQMLEKFLSIDWAVIASSLIFASLHLINPGTGGWFNSMIIISHTLAGMILALLFLRRRTLWIGIGLHFAWNFLEYSVFGLTGMVKEKAVFLITRITGPKIFTGSPQTAFGPETSVEGIIILLILTVILYSRLKAIPTRHDS